MSVHRLRVGTTLRLNNGRRYALKLRLPDGTLKIEDNETFDIVAMARAHFEKCLREGTLEVEGTAAEIAYAEKRAKVSLIPDVNELPEAERDIANRRKEYVLGVRALRDSREANTVEDAIPLVAQRLGDPKPPHFTTVYDWMRKWDARNDYRDLLPRHALKGKCGSRIDVEVDEEMEDVILEKYLTRERIDAQSAFDELLDRLNRINEQRAAADILKPPSRSLFYLRVKELSPYETAVGREGKVKADADYERNKPSPKPTRPLERVEIDHTKLDIFVVQGHGKARLPLGRAWLTLAIDVFTRSIVGFHIGFEEPGYATVAKCLRNMLLPKDDLLERYQSVRNAWNVWGVPETIVVDNGLEFHSRSFEDACRQLGIHIQYAPRKLGRYKAKVERYFRSVNRHFLQKFPGTTFSNVLEKGDYDPKENAILPFELLVEIMVKFVADIYQQRKHRGSREIPALAWERAQAEYPPRIIGSVASLGVILGKIEERVASKSGIEFLGLFFNGDSLEALRKKLGPRPRVKFKYDSDDLARIHVYDPIDRRYWAVPCVAEEYAAGVSEYQHRIIRRHVLENEDKPNVAALVRAKVEISEMVEALWRRRGRTTTAQKLSKWNKVQQAVHGEPTGTLERKVEEDEAASEQQEGGEKGTPQRPQPHQEDSRRGASRRRRTPPARREQESSNAAGDTDAGAQTAVETQTEPPVADAEAPAAALERVESSSERDAVPEQEGTGTTRRSPPRSAPERRPRRKHNSTSRETPAAGVPASEQDDDEFTPEPGFGSDYSHPFGGGR